MHIANTQIQRIFELHLHKVHGSGVKLGSPALSADQLTLSRQATEMHYVRNYVSRLPDIREEKVRDVLSAMESGAYRMSDDDLASAIIAGASRGKVGA